MMMTDTSGTHLRGSTAEQEPIGDGWSTKTPECRSARVAVAMTQGALTSEGSTMASLAGPGRPEDRP